MRFLKRIFFAWLALHAVGVNSQIANFINNGGFEKCANCHSLTLVKKPTGWESADSSAAFGILLSKTLGTAPLNSYTYQHPRHGDAYLISLHFCPTCPLNKRGYPRNRLKETLKVNHVYCFSMHVNLSNQSTHAIDEIGAYFADTSVDTIKTSYLPLPYLNPQVINPNNNLLSDTLKWVLVEGTFTATGTEKYVMIGNFNGDAGTDTVLVNPTNLPTIFSSYSFDDISLIDIDLPAFAGRDTSVIPGDSIFIGREPDVGIDEACIWYKAPDFVNAIDTVAGFWIKPTENLSYVVRQEICGNVKWDTVTVHLNPLRVEKLAIINQNLKVYPVPAENYLELSIANAALLSDFKKVIILDGLGQVVHEQEIDFNKGETRIVTKNLPGGVYSIILKSDSTGTVSKRFVIAR